MQATCLYFQREELHAWQTYRTIEHLRSEAKNASCFKPILLNQLCSTNKFSICCLLQSFIRGINVFRDVKVIQLKV